MVFSVKIRIADYQNLESCEPGTDLHFLTQKVAYALHLQEPSRNSDENWYMAQTAIANYSSYRGTGPLEEFLNACTNSIAFRLRSKATTPKDNWIRAQESLADTIKTHVSFEKSAA